MNIVTTSRTGAPIKPFSWSYSRLKNFEVCPKRHWEIDIAKSIKEEESEELKWGNELHKAAAKHLSTRTPLPKEMAVLQPWCDKIVTGPGNIVVEQKLAITKDFAPCTFFDKAAWFRGVVDALKLLSPVALAIDWKTGKILEDSVQLALTAQCVFSHYPEIQKIRTEFVWLKHDASSRADFSRADMPALWRSLWPRIEALEQAHNTTTYPATPNRLCAKWCPVTSCPHHGKRY
jgi:hypothetical protein